MREEKSMGCAMRVAVVVRALGIVAGLGLAGRRATEPPL